MSSKPGEVTLRTDLIRITTPISCPVSLYTRIIKQTCSRFYLKPQSLNLMNPNLRELRRSACGAVTVTCTWALAVVFLLFFFYLKKSVLPLAHLISMHFAFSVFSSGFAPIPVLLRLWEKSSMTYLDWAVRHKPLTKSAGNSLLCKSKTGSGQWGKVRWINHHPVCSGLLDTPQQLRQPSGFFSTLLLLC